MTTISSDPSSSHPADSELPSRHSAIRAADPQNLSASGAKLVVLWRHGRTAWNASGKLQGQSDVELDEVGHQQIEPAAHALAAAFPNAVIVTSDLQRARQTANELARLTGVTPILEGELRERSFGQWEGLNRVQIAERWPAQFQAWQQATNDEAARPPAGESRREVGRRVAAAVRRHAAEAPPGSVLLVVSHGAAITAAITELIGEDAGDWHGITGLNNANWSVLSPTKFNANWRLVGHNLSATPLAIGEVFGA